MLCLVVRNGAFEKIKKTTKSSALTTICLKLYKDNQKAELYYRMNIQDRRRILGPSAAKPIAFAPGPEEDLKAEEGNVHLNKNEEESMFIQNDLVVNANGSSYLEQNVSSHHTLLLTSVYGPRPIRGSFTAKANLSVQFKETTLEKWDTGKITEICNFLTTVFNSVINLERYPKSSIDIFLNLIQHNDTKRDSELSLVSILPYCINGITLALVDAGIEIADLMSAGAYENSVVAFIKNGEELVGLWHDGDETDISKVVAECKKQYHQGKSSMLHYLASRKKE